MATGINWGERNFESIQSTGLICTLSHHCEQVEDILVEVGISCEVVITTHAGHARYSIFLLHFFVIQFVRQKIRNPFFLQQIYVVHHKAKTCDTGSLWAVVKLATMAGWSLSQVTNNLYKLIDLIKYKSESESRRKTLKCSEIFAKSFIGTVKSICHHSNKRTQIMS